MVKPSDVAQEIIFTCNQKDQNVTLLELEGLIFFTQKEYFEKKKELLFSEEFIVTPFGFRVPTVYRKYLFYGASSLTTSEGTSLDKEIKEIISQVVKRFRGYNYEMLGKEIKQTNLYDFFYNIMGNHHVVYKESLLRFFMGM